MSGHKLDLGGLEEVAQRYADARNEVREWGERRGLSFETALRWVAGWANENGMLKG